MHRVSDEPLGLRDCANNGGTSVIKLSISVGMIRDAIYRLKIVV